MRDTFVRCLEAYAKEHQELVLVTGDLGFGVLRNYIAQFPERFINAGISEQAMMSMAAGLALEGKTVVVYSIGNFPTLRCLEQIRNCCAYHNANVKIVCVGAGFVYGTLGMTHHATEDMSALRMLPGVRVYAPADALETEAVMPLFLSEPGVAYLRIGRGGEPHCHEAGEIRGYQTGKALEQFSGTDAYLLTAGGILPSAIEAAKLLKAEGKCVGVASFPTIKPLDEEYLASICKKVSTLFTVEEHTIIGGFGGAVCECVSGFKENRARVVRLGLNDTYCAIVGNQAYLEKQFGLDGPGIADKVRRVLSGVE
ncbi:MAG: transketolase C-terminal domain-containing protein [Eubacteriales bacterium]|nr:transketolase C-terminal domain-containing protein [Eubacteriales bacterium]